VLWGYKGQRTADAVSGITVADVRWLHEIIGGVTDEQVAAALRASGGNETEIAGFTKAIRRRLGQMAAIVESSV
jgi:hypothetical protein